MKDKKTRWYLLWFVGCGIWALTFLKNFLDGGSPHWLLTVQFLNIILYFCAGVLNAKRYRRRLREKNDAPPSRYNQQQ